MNAKNPAAVALGKLRRGVKERPSEAKRAAVRANLAKARLARWPSSLNAAAGPGFGGGRHFRTCACWRGGKCDCDQIRNRAAAQL